MNRSLSLAALLPVFLWCATAHAADPEIEQLKAELKTLKTSYQDKLATLDQRLNELETAQANTQTTVQVNTPIQPTAPIQMASVPVQSSVPTPVSIQSNPAAFNPALGLVLNGEAASFSQKNSNISGFAVGEEGERGKEGLGIGESELTLNANVDDMFAGQFTGAVVTEDGQDNIEIEEAYVQTLGLPYGANIKAGRMLANLGYMNEKHAHTDDFTDRPLPYRAFLNSAFNDDGIQLSLVLPTDLYTEVGGGAWRGADFPGSEAGNAGSPGSYSAYARVGGDIGDNQTWRLGGSYLRTQAQGGGRITGDTGTEQIFKGNDNLYIADAKYTWAPTGNADQKELDLQGEYFLRHENGTYEDVSIASPVTPYRANQSGYYAQAVYKFRPQWRVGYRFTGLQADDAPITLAGGALDSQGHDPYVNSIMGDYTHSEFSRVRLQYNDDHTGPETDNQFIAQYIMSLGAHGAHKY